MSLHDALPGSGFSRGRCLLRGSEGLLRHSLDDSLRGFSRSLGLRSGSLDGLELGLAKDLP